VNRRPHDPGAKAQARQLYEQHGARRAAELSGVPRRTIAAWAKGEAWQRRLATAQPPDQHVAPVADTRSAVAKRPVAIGYGSQRRTLLRQLAEEAGACLRQLAAEREAGRSGAARNWAWCVGILLERAELLAKQTGPDQGGHPDAAGSVARIHELLDGIEQRRTAGRG
jgi:hypothetical protein